MNLRKAAIGCVVLGTMILAYLAYMQMGNAPVMDMRVRDELVHGTEESGSSDLSGNVGHIGQVGIGSIKQTHLFHTDETGRVDREFGFEELLHTEGDQWGITNPWMRLSLGGINCRITADRGQLQLDTAFDRPSPDDATFTGNVVIRVTPSEPNDPMEFFIYLDDLAFIADNSMFNTTGAVKFVSRSAQLMGRGMELLYDETRSRLELFRVKDLESLRFRSQEFASFSDATSLGRTAETTDANAPDVSTVRVVTDTPDVADEPTPDFYECVLHRNVTITAPEQWVLAKDRLVISNILWSGPESDKPKDKADATSVAATAADPNADASEDAQGPARTAMDTSPSTAPALDAIPESSFDVVVACDGGLVIAPKGSASLEPDLSALGLEAAASEIDANEPPIIDPNRHRLIAHRIDFDFATTNTMLGGPVSMTFALDPNDLTGRDPGAELMPVTISAKDSVQFIAASTRIQLDGDCVVTLHKTEPNLAYEYMMTAPMLAVELVEEPNEVTGEKTLGLKRFEASGGPVAVCARRYLEGERIGSVDMYSSRLDYEGDAKTFAITGPGEIRFHNGQSPETPIEPNEFSLSRPCFAFLQDFDSLTYSAQTNKIVADANDHQILLDYLPLIDGSYTTRHVKADAGRIEIALTQTDAGRTELLSLTASQGVGYEDPLNRFHGAVLFYDHSETLVTVNGDSRQSCSFNGVAVDRIRMNLTTGVRKAEVLGPSTIQIRP